MRACWPRHVGVCRRVAHVGSASTPLPLSCATAVTAALRTARRTIIVPRQLKAYGDTFSRSIGERSDHLAGHVVLQSLSPSATRASPLLGKPVKTRGVDSFADMLLAPQLQDVLATRLQVTTPSPVQQIAIEPQLQRRNTLLAAPHGEGKTLAFLLPLYHNLLKDRDVYKIPLRERRPRAIVLAPTRELLAQLHAQCRVLDAATGLTSVAFASRKRASHHVSRMLRQRMPDVLLMHPLLVLRLLRVRRLFLDDLRYVVVDEADTMLSSQHDHHATHLLAMARRRMLYKYLWPVETQFVFSTAYVTRKLEYYVGKRFPDTVPCLHRQRMHRPATTLQHRFLLLSREQERLSYLTYLLHKHGHVPRRVDTDEAEAQLRTQPYKYSDTFADYKARHRARDGALPRLTSSSSSRGSSDEDDGAKTPSTSVSSSSLHPHTTATATVTTTMTTTSTPARNDNNNGDDYDDYAHDWHARTALERVRPVHWEHLTTRAAPFTCHVRRRVFAPDDSQRVLLFCRTIDAAVAFFHQLRAAGYAVSLLHASLPPNVRRGMLADFASGRTNILCATDMAARGLDMHVDVVVNVDMPTNALTYLGRAGRAARMGRLGRVYSLYTRRQRVIVAAVRAFVARNVPLEGISNDAAHMRTPRYAEWRRHKINALSRAYVTMLTSKVIPAHLERSYVRHNATWRPLFHPHTVTHHAGVPPRQQHALMDRVMHEAVWYRREQLARRKGGRAKFGSFTSKSGVWNDVGGVAWREGVHASQEANPAGPNFGPPQGPPE